MKYLYPVTVLRLVDRDYSIFKHCFCNHQTTFMKWKLVITVSTGERYDFILQLGSDEGLLFEAAGIIHEVLLHMSNANSF